MIDRAPPKPPWLNVLNALQQEWRESEILRGRNPDRELEKLLYVSGKWPPRSEPEIVGA